ncbi:MAG: DUF4358 domain-containing protein [Clostridia bacterium]|nr:DUF4358 domain-containing protein [Clostridia bacterium]
MKLKRTLSLSLAALMLVSALAGCTSTEKPQESDKIKTPEELTTSYKAAIEGARSQEANDAFAIITTPDDNMADMIFEMLGVTADDMTAYAISVSAMNTQAYGIVAIMPAADKSDKVQEGLNAFVEQQKNNFKMYLMGQYDIANAAKVETLDDGTILLVMCDGQDAILSSIKDALK